MSDSLKSGAGRPNKKGLDYFAHLITHTDEENILFQQFGCTGYTVYYVMREKITENGYYYELNERKRTLLCSQFQIKESDFIKIINLAIELDLFDKTIFETYGVLTSERLQISYILAAARRKKIDFYDEYFLVTDVAFITKIGDEKLYEKITLYAINDDTNSINANINSINVDINSINVNTNSINVNTNSQRKRKRERKSKSKEIEKETVKEKRPAQARSVGKGYKKESAERENKGKPILDIIAMPNEEFEQKYMN